MNYGKKNHEHVANIDLAIKIWKIGQNQQKWVVHLPRLCDPSNIIGLAKYFGFSLFRYPLNFLSTEHFEIKQFCKNGQATVYLIKFQMKNDKIVLLLVLLYTW